MNNKVRLPQAAIIVTLGILLSLVTQYVPMLSILGLVIPVPYAMIGTLTNSKYSFLSVVATFFVLMFTVNPIYSVTICIMKVLPGIAIGSVAKEHLKQGEVNKFEPIYMGMIANVLCTIFFFLIANVLFKTNIFESFMAIVKESMNIQVEVMKNTGINLGEGFTVNSMVDFTRNILPTILFIQGLIVSFIVYYFEVFILKRIRIVNLPLPKVADFYLPGNAVTTSFILYMIVLFIDIIGINIHTELIMINLQFVFNLMFTIQGISVCIYFFRKWIKEGSGRMILTYGLILCIFGFMGISFVGMLDSIIDFRKVRSYKSI
ncbi:MAG: DUF2232 domain-containing protein [Peptostreptococcaceae bacterium]